MKIRRYDLGDEPQLWQLFHETIHTVNARDYTPEQLQAWSPAEIDERVWRDRIAGMNPYVCVDDAGMILGYAGLLESGHVDHFYVHHRRQRCGVGRLLMETIEADARSRGLGRLTSDVSITARPFFEAHGFSVVAAQQVQRQGVELTNFKMAKDL
jgi:putative acetyltransferase